LQEFHLKFNPAPHFNHINQLTNPFYRIIILVIDLHYLINIIIINYPPYYIIINFNQFNQFNHIIFIIILMH